MQAREKDNRRDWIIVILIILIGLLCILLAGGWALRLSPSWRLDSNMGSNLDPNSDFLTARSNGLLEPIDSSILTQPAWMDLYLTPGAVFETGTPVPTIVKNTPLPPATQTSFTTPTIILPTRTNTSPIIIYPTNTNVSNNPAPTPTRTFTPSPIPVLSADLSITITDGSATYIPGSTLTYTIVVRNTSGPSAANGATVTDTFPAALSGITWTCTGSAGGTCPASGSGNINHTVNLPVGSFVTYTVNASVSAAATGNLVNTASVTTPASVSDPVPANNTATDTDTPIFNADLRITKADAVTTYVPGTSTTYTIIVSNVGPANVTGATVTDTFPASISAASWNCAASGGATCAAASGSGNLNHTVNIPVGGILTYTVTTTIASSATGNLVNTASVTPPATVTDPAPANNTATDTDTPVYNVNLQITKTDGTATYSPGTTTTYTIVVSNAGPSNATGATVADTFPGQVTGVTWSCAPSGGATCTANGTGNINSTVNIPLGGTLTYTAIATISPAASGNMTNTAMVTAPAGYNETAPGNNSATDTDVAVLSADLSITKTSPSSTYSIGSPIAYTIVVTNNGPNNVTGASVTDFFPSQIATTTWNCSPTAGATCTGSGAGSIIDTVNIPAGGTLTYTITANVNPTATGSISNTATVTDPTGSDPTPGNNSATYTHVPAIDLQITKDDGSTTYVPGGSVIYTVTVTNNSTFALTGITVTDTIPSLVTTWGWCVAPCAPVASTSANLSDTINLAAGSSTSYRILANIHASAAGNLANTATVTVPAGYVEAAPGDNSSTDTDVNQTGEPDVGPPDGNLLTIGDSGSFTFYLNQPINADGLPTADFVIYERGIGTDIRLDQIMVEISQDGVTWFPVFFWGNGPADNNSNVSGFCPGTEDDNCVIPQTSLYNNTGITIDVDGTLLSSVTPGNYYWIRLTEPGLGSVDGAHVDSIQILH